MVSKEEENFLRIVYLNYRVATGALTRFFDKLHPNLLADLHKPGIEASLKLLYKPPPRIKRVLYQGQWDILYPPSGSTPVTSADLDLTLMVCLLRNIPPVVAAPMKGFDVVPLPHEISDGASIARLKYYKNFIISHSKDGLLSNAEFGRIWTELEQAITTLDNSVATATNLKDSKTSTLDSGMAKMLVTQHILATKVSNLQEQFFICNDENEKEKERLKQNQDEEMRIAGVNLELEVKERKGNLDDVSKRLNFNEVKLSAYDKRVANLGKHLEQLQNFQHLLTSEFNRIETIVGESKNEKEAFENQIQSLCCQINEYISKNTERIDELEAQSEKFDETLLDVQKDVDSLKLESEIFKIQTKCVSRKVEDLDAKIKTEDNEHIPRHMRAQQSQNIKDWENDEIFFLETRATHHILSSIQCNSVIVVTGSSGCGKSANIHHAALNLRKQYAYEIILITKPSQILKYYITNKKQVFVVDDICGKETINNQKLKTWDEYSEKLTQIFKDDEKNSTNYTVSKTQCHKLLISCRLHIYKESDFQLTTMLTKKECNLLSPDLCLLKKERMLMMKKYHPGMTEYNVIQIMENVDFFPLLCKLSKEKAPNDVKKLFKAPVASIVKNIKYIISESKMQLLALVLCILFKDGFDTDWLVLGSAPKKENDKLKTIVYEFDIDLNKEMLRHSLISDFNTLDGTYFKRRGTEFRMIHDKIHEISAVICGKRLTAIFIKYAPSVFIRDHFSFESIMGVQEHDDFIKLSKDKEEQYFERLLSDLRKFVISSTFNNKQLIYQSFLDRLISFLGNNYEAKILLKKIDQKGYTVENYLVHTNFDYTEESDLVYNYTTPLIESASGGYFSMVDFLTVTVGCNVNKINHRGSSSLHEAAKGGHSDVVNFLLQHEASVSLYNFYKESPIFVACEAGYTDIVAMLLKMNASVSECSKNGESPLSVACRGGHKDTVELLLQNNAYVSNYTRRRTNVVSPLCAALRSGYTDIAKLLLQNTDEISQCNNEGEFPLYIFSKSGNNDEIKFLLQHNADVFQKTIRISRSQQGLLKTNYDNEVCVNWHAQYGNSSLHIASAMRNIDTVKILLQNNADVSQCNEDEESPLYVACERNNEDIVELLLQNSADVSQCNIYGESPLYVACKTGNTNIAKLLLQNNADVSQCSTYGESPLYVACENGHTSVVKLLLHNNADVSFCTGLGKSPLYIACFVGNADTVKLLLQNNADVSQCNVNGESPLHKACIGAHADIIKMLLQNNADANLLNKKGETPFDLAYTSDIRKMLNRITN